MKLLIINEFIECGGTEIQTLREYDNFTKHGDSVYLLTFDNKEKIVRDNHINVPIKKNVLSKIKYAILPCFITEHKIKCIIKKINPDYIHINGLYSCPKIVYKICNKYKTIQTIRDYGSVCPKKTCIKNDYNECDGYLFDKCNNCKLSISEKIKKILFRINTTSRKKYVKMFLCPSEALTEKSKNNGYNVYCLHNPFDFEKMVVQEKVLTENKTYLYYGLISENKGVFRLIEAFNEFSKDKEDVNLVFIGEIDKNIADTFRKKMCNNVAYLGKMTNNDILAYLNNVYCTVVPSLWIENYPNTVLESKANKTLVIGSNRGGISKMIKNPDLLFNILDKNDIISKLEYTYTLSSKKYYDIVNNNYDDILVNNTLEQYYENLNKYFKMLEM